MPQENKNAREELEQLQLEEARAAAVDRKSLRDQKASRSAAIEMSLRRDRENQRQIQAACLHRKGGRGTAGMYQGNDQNYAVIKHTLSHGPTIVVCQRCTKIWEKPQTLSKKATADERQKYREDLAEYTRAMNLPTDNEPSGTQLFMITREEESVA